MTETTILVSVRYRNRNSNWPILSADTVTDTETTASTTHCPFLVFLSKIVTGLITGLVSGLVSGLVIVSVTFK